MKINIGPYKYRWDTNNLEDKWFVYRYGEDYRVDGVPKTKYTLADQIVVGTLNVWDKILEVTVNKLIDKIERRVKVHIDKYDLWNADHTLALVITPVLIGLRESKHGAPHVDDEDVPDNLKKANAPKTENEWDADEFHFDRWDWVLGEMIFAFQSLANDDWEEQFYADKGDPVELIDHEDGTVEFVGGPTKFDLEGYKAYNARIDNGLRLFGKYYRGLWD